ncbi:MAG: divergent polysaccharide deacetylase family protein [Bacillota bacterium]
MSQQEKLQRLLFYLAIVALFIVVSGFVMEMVINHINQPNTKRTNLLSQANGSTKAAPKAKVAIVIDDFGQANTEGVREIFAIDRPLTCAIMPHLEFTQKEAKEAKEKGFEIIVHLPLEPNYGKASWLGPGAITAKMTVAEIKKVAYEDFAAVPNAVGFNNHLGSLITSREDLISPVLQVAKTMGFFVLDSRTSEQSKVIPLAQNLGIAYTQRDVFLDNVKNVTYIKKQLNILADRAIARGSAVGIGHVGLGGEKTAQAIKEMIPVMEARGIEFVFLSASIPYSAAARKPLQSKIIAIDPGHGGYDPGVTRAGVKEKDINLEVSKLLKKKLENNGARVIMTRTADYNHAVKGLHGREAKRYDLNERINMIQKDQATVLLTVHVNSSRKTSYSGAEAFYHPKSENGKLLAYAIQQELRSIPGMTKRMPKYSDCYMIKNTAIPAVLVEIGYLTNPEEREKLHNPAYWNILTEKIVAGIINYFNAPDKIVMEQH